MPPTIVEKLSNDDTDKHDGGWDGEYFRKIWDGFAHWIVRFFRGVNRETIEHPYFIAIALFVVAAWPHLLCLPIWFTKDLYRRTDSQIRGVANSISNPRRRKRDFFITRYRAVTNANYQPPPRAEFGGTPLSDGDFTIEHESNLHIVLRVIRWSAIGWAAFILGREWYFVLRG